MAKNLTTASRCPPSEKDAARSAYTPKIGAHRVFYVATLGEAVFVLHSFVKKSQKTPQQDINIGKARYKQAQEQS